MVQRRHLLLTPEARARLERTRDHAPRPYLRERCAALLKVADGQSAHAVALHGLREDVLAVRVAEGLGEVDCAERAAVRAPACGGYVGLTDSGHRWFSLREVACGHASRRGGRTPCTRG